MTTFKLNARNLIRFAKQTNKTFIKGIPYKCAVGMALKAVGSRNTTWSYHANGMSRAAKVLGLTPDQLRSFENGFEGRPTGLNRNYHFFYNRNLMPKKLDMRYYNMGKNVRRLALSEGIIY